jgi:hypothetical protein
MDDSALEEKKKEAFRLGAGVMFLLAVFTFGEYWLGSVASVWYVPLLAIAVIKAFLVVRDYMHLPRLFAGEEEGEE